MFDSILHLTIMFVRITLTNVRETFSQMQMILTFFVINSHIF